MRSLADTVARIAGDQHGRITSRQLLAVGVDVHRIRRWVADGRLHREHVGVYAVGHPGRSTVGDYMAAVLAAGSGATLSHAPVAHLLRVIRGAPPPPQVTVPTLGGRTRPGIVIHRVRALHPLDVSVYEGIPITTVPRTLVDLAPALTLEQLTRACHEAWVHHRTTPDQIEACIARNPRKPAVAQLRRAYGADATLSDLEDLFAALLRRHALPIPRTNIDHAGDKVDCHWPQLGLTVELVSYRFHATRRAFEVDVARRRRSGHVAFSYGDIAERPAQTLRELTRLLSATA
jgi:hypothetical protein